MTTTSKSLSAEMIKDKILNSRGQFVKVKWKSNPSPAAPFKKTHTLEKVTEGVVRAGIDYANLSSVKDAIASGSRGEVQPLPFGEWISFPYLIKHRPKGSEEDVIYVRLYPSIHIPKSLYYVNGENVDKETFATFLTPSESKKLLEPTDNRPECFTIKEHNILGIPEEVVE